MEIIHMNNEKDWKEIEKWNELRKIEREEKYGTDITKLGKHKKEIDEFAKVLNVIVKTLYYIGKGAVILAIILAILWVIDTCIGAREILN